MVVLKYDVQPSVGKRREKVHSSLFQDFDMEPQVRSNNKKKTAIGPKIAFSADNSPLFLNLSSGKLKTKEEGGTYKGLFSDVAPVPGLADQLGALVGDGLFADQVKAWTEKQTGRGVGDQRRTGSSNRIGRPSAKNPLTSQLQPQEPLSSSSERVFRFTAPPLREAIAREK